MMSLFQVLHIIDDTTDIIMMSLQVLHIIDDTTDIIYNVAAEAAGGIVSSRSNFVTN